MLTYRPRTMLLFSVLLTLSACTLTNSSNITTQLDEMQSIALCQHDELALRAEEKITAEYGFKRFAKNTYRPVLEHRLFGHDIRVVELGDHYNKLYAAGNPHEFGHHFTWILKSVHCQKDSCQAPINDTQTLHIYKPAIKKAKDTTVIECTKAPTSL